jgi:beta-N-acetylhexosaminidase
MEKIVAIIFVFLLMLPAVADQNLNQGSLTLKEKVGQLIMVQFPGDSVTQEVEHWIKDLHIGGLVLSGNFSSQQQLAELTGDLQKLSTIPLLLAVDHTNLDFPTNMALGAINSENLTYEVAKSIGNELRETGINMDFAPCIDITTKLNNPVGAESFGSDGDMVGNLSNAFINGLRDANVIQAAKHYIGYGSIEKDHRVLRGTVEEQPLLKVIENNVSAIVSGNLIVPEIDPKYPITISQRGIDHLRGLGFDGVVISNCLNELRYESLEEPAILAINAGNDMIQIEKGIEEVIDTIVKNVKNGAIKEERIDEAVNRIMDLKKEYAEDLVHEDKGIEQVNPVDIARKSITLINNKILPIEKDSSIDLITENENFEDHLKKYTENIKIFDYETKEFEESDYIILCTEGEKGRELIARLDKSKLIVVALGAPEDIFYFPEIENYLAGYGANNATLKALAETIFGKNEAKGKLPIILSYPESYSEREKVEILTINYVSGGKVDKEATGSAEKDPKMFYAEYSTETRKIRVGLHPSSAGCLNATVLIGANFTSPVIEGSVNVTIDIYGGIKGYIENSLTEGNVEIIAAVKDITTNETTGEQIFYFGAADGKEIDMPFKTSIKFVLKENHRYFAYIEIRAHQNSNAFITGKIDFWSRDYGVWYDKMMVWI